MGKNNAKRRNKQKGREKTMRGQYQAAIGAVAILLIFAIMYIGLANSITSKSIAIDTAESEMESQYQRQADLIPNLIAVTNSAVNPVS